MNYEIILPSKPRSVSEEDETRGLYEIDNLQPGYGYTLGNALRRVILSSLPGAAITSVKIDDVKHEFATIPGVKEDVVTILLNLKQVRFKMHTDDPQKITLNAKGIKKVTAKDFKTPTQVEVANGNLEIANLTSKNASLSIEATIEKGLGYLPREILHKEKVDIGVMTLDAILTPIRKVNYEVENMRVGERTDYNRLRIAIETDGTITPRQALEQATDILIKQFTAMKDLGVEAEKTKEKEAVPAKKEEVSAIKNGEMPIEDPLKIRVEDLDLSQRTLKSLVKANIRTVGGVVKKKEKDILEIEGIGQRALQEIRRAIGYLGLTLKEK